MNYFAPKVNFTGFKVENDILINSTFLESSLKPQILFPKYNDVNKNLKLISIEVKHTLS